MLRLNRTTEYALIALRHLERNGEKRITAREIADAYGLPFEITAKTLQKLKESGLILATQGAQGGYRLARRLLEIKLSEFLEAMEGSQSVVPCQSGCACEYRGQCEVMDWMNGLNSKVQRFLSNISLGDLAFGAQKPRLSFEPSLGEEP